MSQDGNITVADCSGRGNSMLYTILYSILYNAIQYNIKGLCDTAFGLCACGAAIAGEGGTFTSSDGY